MVQTAIAASRKHQAQQSWLAMTQTHLLVCFHAKSTNYILDKVKKGRPGEMLDHHNR